VLSLEGLGQHVCPRNSVCPQVTDFPWHELANTIGCTFEQSTVLSCRAGKRTTSFLGGFRLPSTRLTKQVEFVFLNRALWATAHHSSPQGKAVSDRHHLM